MLVGDFNAENSEACLSNFLLEIDVKNIVNNYTCYKIVKNPNCIDPVITNWLLSFLNMVTISTSLSDFHEITVLKTAFSKLVSKKMSYRDYKIFNRDKFKRALEVKIKL